MSNFSIVGKRVSRQPNDNQKKQFAAFGEIASLTAIARKTDAEITSYVTAQVTDLASAKTMLILLARAVAALIRDRGIV